MPPYHPRAFFLVGPTAAGKTAVAQWLAEQRQAEILSADSMLVYRGMDIGTAKPAPAERGDVRYWGIDQVAPSEPFNVALFLAEARRCFEAAAASGHPVIVVGGTGLYVKALLEGLDDLPDIPRARREYWQAYLEREGVQGLCAALGRLNPRWLASVDGSNARRLVRALELVEAGVGEPPRSWRREASRPRVTGLALERALLKARIAERVEAMYAGGLLQEVERLLAQGWDAASTAAQAIGYAEAIACLKGELTPAAARELTASRTRQLAKRQMTWFRHQAHVAWVDVRPGLSVAEIASRVAAEWDATGPQPVALELA